MGVEWFGTWPAAERLRGMHDRPIVWAWDEEGPMLERWQVAFLERWAATHQWRTRGTLRAVLDATPSLVLEVRSADECALLGWVRVLAPPGGFLDGQIVEVLVPLAPPNLLHAVELRLHPVAATPTVPAPPYGLAALASVAQYAAIVGAPAFTDLARAERAGPVMPGEH